ncbi:craniofacial development protein 2-like [Capsicum annuum]|uniref:craniofacial development protein 2-like n=1 Tax=Capsicum annuum TaxID=4072 RepID=UPI001FB175D0|nr:craniofacial development protein 2-like [Capsicum annuum]
MGGFTVNVISAYAPQVGLDEEEKKEFWEVLDKMVRNIPSTEKLFVGGDFNGHIGSLSKGYDNVHGGFDFGERNEGGTSLMDFSRDFRSWIANSRFLKKKDHLITFRSVLGDLKISEEGRYYSYYRRIGVKKVKGAIRRMRRGRATGPNEFQ